MDSLSHFISSAIGTGIGVMVAHGIHECWTYFFPKTVDGEAPDAIVKFKKLHPEARLPFFAKPGDAGADLTSVEDVTLMPGEFRLVRTGLAIELPEGWEAQVRSRSGLALKSGIHVLNSPGTIDSGYRGEIGAVLINHGPMFHIEKGARIAQLVVKPTWDVSFIEAVELSETERGSGGFGHTGVNS